MLAAGVKVLDATAATSPPVSFFAMQHAVAEADQAPRANNALDSSGAAAAILRVVPKPVPSAPTEVWEFQKRID